MGLSEVLASAAVLGEDDEPRHRELGEYDTVFFRTASATIASGFVGFMAGNAKALWRYQIPRKDLEAVNRATVGYMHRYAVTFALVGGSYAFADAIIERYRGKRNFANSIYAGVAAGAVYGIRVRSLPWGLGTGALFAASTAIMDALGHTTRRKTDREFLPYPNKS